MRTSGGADTSRSIGVGVGAALLAAFTSVVAGVLVPYTCPWPTLILAILALAAAVWTGLGSTRPAPRMSEVIDTVEAEVRRGPLWA
jgi:hypothetical protein